MAIKPLHKYSMTYFNIYSLTQCRTSLLNNVKNYKTKTLKKYLNIFKPRSSDWSLWKRLVGFEGSKINNNNNMKANKKKKKWTLTIHCNNHGKRIKVKEFLLPVILHTFNPLFLRHFGKKNLENSFNTGNNNEIKCKVMAKLLEKKY